MSAPTSLWHWAALSPYLPGALAYTGLSLQPPSEQKALCDVFVMQAVSLLPRPAFTLKRGFFQTPAAEN